MRAAGLLAVSLGAALVTATLQACWAVCADCNCGSPGDLVVNKADRAELVGAVVRDLGSQLTIEYDKDWVHWTVTYDLVVGDTGG